MKKRPFKDLALVYEQLFKALGPQGWWPARTPLEVAVGAVLTQNTSWLGVERAIANLRTSGALSARALHAMPTPRLARLIRPSGYFNIKAKRLKSFIAFLCEGYGGSMKRMGREETGTLREKLLAVNGIGPETADSILLYALGHPSFVIDAYTRRILGRHGVRQARGSYEDLQGVFHHSTLATDAGIYNEYHALLVAVGKNFCRPKKPLCEGCPLNDV